MLSAIFNQLSTADVLTGHGQLLISFHPDKSSIIRLKNCVEVSQLQSLQMIKHHFKMKEKIVALLFLITGVVSLDFHNLQVDEISGELIKPSNWSEAKFRTVKELRLSVSSEEQRLQSSNGPELDKNCSHHKYLFRN